jgi:hypothetical protein
MPRMQRCHTLWPFIEDAVSLRPPRYSAGHSSSAIPAVLSIKPTHEQSLPEGGICLIVYVARNSLRLTSCGDDNNRGGRTSNDNRDYLY